MASNLENLEKSGNLKPRSGKPGKAREFETYLENLEKSLLVRPGKVIVGQGK